MCIQALRHTTNLARHLLSALPHLNGEVRQEGESLPSK